MASIGGRQASTGSRSKKNNLRTDTKEINTTYNDVSHAKMIVTNKFPKWWYIKKGSSSLSTKNFRGSVIHCCQWVEGRRAKMLGCAGSKCALSELHPSAEMCQFCLNHPNSPSSSATSWPPCCLLDDVTPHMHTHTHTLHTLRWE